MKIEICYLSCYYNQCVPEELLPARFSLELYPICNIGESERCELIDKFVGA